MKVEIGVLSADPERTSERYPGVRCFDVSRGRFRAVVSAVRWSDVVVVGGGELVQDVSSLLYTPYNLFPLFLSRFFRKSAYAWAVGIGLRSELAWWTPFLTRLAFRACSGISVRDKSSFGFLRNLGFREPELVLAADCALTLSVSPRAGLCSTTLGAAPRNVSNRSRKFLPLELRKKFGLHREADPLPAADSWAQLLDSALDAYASEVILFPFHTGSLSNDDRSFCELVKSRMKAGSRVRLADPSQPEDFLEKIGLCRVLVTTPLHGAIMSVANGTVPVSVSYSSKCVRFMEQAGLGKLISFGDAGLPGNSTFDVVTDAWENWTSIRNDMLKKREALVKRAEKTASHFAEMVAL